MIFVRLKTMDGEIFVDCKEILMVYTEPSTKTTLPLMMGTFMVLRDRQRIQLNHSLNEAIKLLDMKKV